MKNDTILKRHFRDLAEKAYQKNIYTFTNFLSDTDLELFYEILPDISYVPYTIYGGQEASERVMLRFGSEELTGYDAPFPIEVLQVAPLLDRFSEELSHRDLLGALMNLGIERDMIGDILLTASEKSGIKNTAYIFCVSSISPFLIEQFTRVRHTSVSVKLCPETALAELRPSFEDVRFIVASARIDAVVAAITKQSRSKATELFREKKIFLNNRTCENTSYVLKPDDLLTIRGMGKYRFQGAGQETRKGRIYITLKHWV